MAGTQIATKDGMLTAGAKLPEAFGRIIHLEGWARAIVFKEKYKEPNPDFLSAMLAMQAITATTVEEVFQRSGILKVQEWVKDEPGASSGPLEMTDLYVAESDFETGNPCFVIMTVMSLATGEEMRMTTGATNIQGTLIGLLKLGTWPIRFQIKRGDTKDKGGHYLLFMLPPD